VHGKQLQKKVHDMQGHALPAFYPIRVPEVLNWGSTPYLHAQMQEVSVDLAENLNKVSGFSHLLIVKCAPSGFALILPFTSNSSSEVIVPSKTVYCYNIQYKECILTMPMNS
jgi:hypothetical protein